MLRRGPCALVLGCTLGLLGGDLLQPASGQTAEIEGTMVGKVYERTSRTALTDVVVTAQRITRNERFSGSPTDARGSYVISNVPAGIYAFYLNHEGTEYPVPEHFDVRMGMEFLLETCFELDIAQKTASLVRECKSGVYADTQIVSIGPHRFLRRDSGEGQEQEGQEQATATEPSVSDGLLITHQALECCDENHFPQLGAVIEPFQRVHSSRVYFRAAQYPDFYFVEMRPTEVEGVFVAILPKPSPETEQIIYYIEAVDSDFNNAQTEEHDPEVTDDESCRRRSPAAFFEGDSPNIVVGATVSGVSAVPAGFQAAGITGFISAAGVATGAVVAGGAAGAAGIGATTVIVVTGATVVGTTVVVTATTGGSEPSPVK